MISHKRLLEQLAYSPRTGFFRWRVSKARVVAGDVAGTLTPLGYIAIKLDQHVYAAHRLAWFYMTDRWPKHQLDHINRVRHDNRWTNLREATNKQNHENAGLAITNTSGVRGVRWDASRERWFAFITHNQVMRNLGRYTKKTDAVAARRRAERELFTHAP